jgi:hypothetical protein
MAIKKTTSKQKMGPLGNPLGNPLGFFNSLKGKTKPEPKQTLKKAQDGIVTNTTQGPLSKEDTESIDERYNNDINLFNKFGRGKMPTIGGYSPVPELLKKDNIERVRSSPTFNTSKTNLYQQKKGGPVKYKKK